MANKPFDQRVINQLERPTSSDLNIAQSQLNLGSRALMRQLLQQNPIVVGTGSLGESFFVEKIAGDRSFKIKRGVGFNYAAYNASTDSNIGSPAIRGLSDPFDYRMVSIQDEAGVPFDVEPAPASGYCRRDVVAIRCTNPSAANQLTDQEPTDIYDTFTNDFGTSSVDKTFTYDISGATPQVLNYDAIASATASVVYVTGPVIPYSAPDDLLNAPAPVLGPTYLNIAIINVVGGATTVAQSDVVDFRRLVAPQGNLVVSGSATIGADAGLPGKTLSGVTLKTPPGIKAQIWKFGNGEANSYLLFVYGPRNVTSASMSFSTSANSLAYADLSAGGTQYILRPTQIIQGPIQINQGANATVQGVAANSAYSSPVQTVAVGQPYHLFPFTLCRVDNATSTVTEPLTLDLTIDPLVIPNPPGYPSQWPAGTRSVENFRTTQTFYMNWDQAPTSPTTGLQSPYYYLNETPSQVEDTYSVALSGGTTRIAGFVTALSLVQNKTIQTGTWRISLNMSSQSDSVRVLARAYLYNGSTNPELGTLIGESDETYIYDGSTSLRYQDLYIPIVGPISTGSNRVYIVLYAVNSVNGQGITIKFNGASPAVVETNILIDAPTVTIQATGPNYPAGTYPITGTATSTPVTIDVAGVMQRLNSKATDFSSKTGLTIPTVPITFTLNLTVE